MSTRREVAGSGIPGAAQYVSWIRKLFIEEASIVGMEVKSNGKTLQVSVLPIDENDCQGVSEACEWQGPAAAL
jgi:hypothetical protein